MHSLLWNMPHSWYAHMIILQCHSHLGGSWSQNFMPKSYTSAKSLPCGAEPTKHTIKKVCSKCAYWIWSKAYVSPKNVSSSYTDKHWNADKVVFAQRHNFKVVQNTANRAFPSLKTCFAADTSERCERSLPLINHLGEFSYYMKGTLYV
jgi:hypothetical protein